MYHSAFSPAMVSSPFGRAQQFARMYAQVGLETQVEAASPHQLVLMLFDGFLESVGRARLAMQAKLIEVKCQQIGRAVRILDEGHGTDASVRTLIDTAYNGYSWTTVGVGTNVIEASWEALMDSLAYGILTHLPPA